MGGAAVSLRGVVIDASYGTNSTRRRTFLFLFLLLFVLFSFSFRVWNWNADEVQLDAVERLVKRKYWLPGR